MLGVIAFGSAGDGPRGAVLGFEVAFAVTAAVLVTGAVVSAVFVRADPVRPAVGLANGHR